MRIEAYLQKSPVYQIRLAARALTGRVEQMLRADGCDLSFLEALVLVSIFFEDPRQALPSRLADTFSTTRGNISHCVSSLEAKGLLRRRIDTEDTRSFHLILKPTGRKRAIELIRIFDSLQTQLERRIGVVEIESALTLVRQLEQACCSLARTNADSNS